MNTPDNVTAQLLQSYSALHLPHPADRGPKLLAQNLERFNTAPAPEARHTLLTCLHSPRWARCITAHRPYPDLPSLLAAADEATYDLGPADLAEALAAEPLPSLPGDTYAAASTALSAAYAAYEARFGHGFVICLDDVAPDEALDRVLAAVRSRLANDPEDERVMAAEQLRRLARERLTGLLGARAGDDLRLRRVGAHHHDGAAPGF